jgi:hypothetical protein
MATVRIENVVIKIIDITGEVNLTHGNLDLIAHLPSAPTNRLRWSVIVDEKATPSREGLGDCYLVIIDDSRYRS